MSMQVTSDGLWHVVHRQNSSSKSREELCSGWQHVPQALCHSHGFSETYPDQRLNSSQTKETNLTIRVFMYPTFTGNLRLLFPIALKLLLTNSESLTSWIRKASTKSNGKLWENSYTVFRHTSISFIYVIVRHLQYEMPISIATSQIFNIVFIKSMQQSPKNGRPGGQETPRLLYRMIEKSHNPFLTHVLFVKKINYTEIRKQKTTFIKCCKCLPRSAMHAFNLFLVFDATRWRVSAVTFEMHSSMFCFNSWHWRIGKCIPKLILANSTISTRCTCIEL
jgi:hypothetical protein